MFEGDDGTYHTGTGSRKAWYVRNGLKLMFNHTVGDLLPRTLINWSETHCYLRRSRSLLQPGTRPGVHVSRARAHFRDVEDAAGWKVCYSGNGVYLGRLGGFSPRE